MIPAAACRVLIAAMMFSLASGARADVLELGADGARWVAGPLAGSTAVPDPAVAMAGQPLAMAENVTLPDFAIADPARHAAGVPPRYAAKIASRKTEPVTWHHVVAAHLTIQDEAAEEKW
jgi:hypothetical protein